MFSRQRRACAHGLIEGATGTARAGTVLLVPADGGGRLPGAGWRLPGGVIEHGEAPAEAAARLLGLPLGAIGALRALVTDVSVIDATAADGGPVDGGPVDGVVWHLDRFVFDVSPPVEGPGRWLDPGTVTLAPFTARALGRPAPVVSPPPESIAVASVPVAGARRQRFAAYGLVTDPAGRVLLSRIAEGYPSAGHWHLPGGGTDFGEEAAAGFLRELIEETDQVGQVTGLLAATHHHKADEIGPEGVPLDWHAIRVVFRALVSRPTPARVTEVGGSTAAAAWLTRDEALRLPLTGIAREMLLTTG